jgi:hypothetical protein
MMTDLIRKGNRYDASVAILSYQGADESSAKN